MSTARWVALASTIVVSLLLAALLWPVAPFLVDDARLDGIVRAVALDWRDFGEAEARERLAFELDSQAIWQGVGDDHCRLESAESGARRIHCAWDVEVQAWWGVFPMSFESEARMNPAGDLL